MSYQSAQPNTNLNRVVFETHTVLDIKCVTTFGVNVKVTDNPIGQFGTGLKYAIAVLLREGHEVLMNIGMKSYYFALQETAIRGEDFDVITMNKEPLAFTTKLGAHWELWMAFRELYSNTKDEEGSTYADCSTPDKTEGWTTITVFGEDFVQVMNDKSEVFFEPEAEDTKLQHSGAVNYYSGMSDHVFNRGIRIAELPKPTKFVYDIPTAVTLTEDRNLKNESDLQYMLARDVMGSSDEVFIKTMVTATEDEYEYIIPYSFYASYSETFYSTVEALAKRKRNDLTPTCLRWYDLVRDEAREKRNREEKCGARLTIDLLMGEHNEDNILETVLEALKELGVEVEGTEFSID